MAPSHRMAGLISASGRRSYGSLAGFVIVLVTGRVLQGLRQVAGDLSFLDAVVAENGAVISFPGSTSRLLASRLRGFSQRASPSRNAVSVRQSMVEAMPTQRLGFCSHSGYGSSASTLIQPKPPDGSAPGVSKGLAFGPRSAAYAARFIAPVGSGTPNTMTICSPLARSG